MAKDKDPIPFPAKENQDAPAPEASPQPEPQPIAPPVFTIPLSVLQDIVNYLVDRPYKEVGHLIKAVEATAKKV